MKNYFRFLSFESLNHQYLVKTSITLNKYSTLLLLEYKDAISAKSTAQILSLKLAQTLLLLNFLIAGLCIFGMAIH